LIVRGGLAPGLLHGDADPGETAGARQAALLLHAMSPIDQAWMLDAMPVRQRETLQALLAELASLGIAVNPALIADATMPVSDEEQLLSLAGDRLDVVIRALRSEPAALIAGCLRAADWPWRDDLLHSLEPTLRARVNAALASTTVCPLPPALRTALIAAVAARLHGLVPNEPSPRRWHAVRESLRVLWRRPRVSQGRSG